MIGRKNTTYNIFDYYEFKKQIKSKSMTNKERLKTLEERYETISEESDRLREQINRLKKDIWHEEFGINIGDTVSFLDYKTEKKGVLHSIDISWSDPKPIVTLFKKDGTIGTRTTRVWDAKSLKKLL